MTRCACFRSAQGSSASLCLPGAAVYHILTGSCNGNYHAEQQVIVVGCFTQAIEQVPEEQKESITRTAKMRTLGNIRLIAELFKKSVVPEKIVHMCIQDLTGDAKQEPSENNVEVSNTEASDAAVYSNCYL